MRAVGKRQICSGKAIIRVSVEDKYKVQQSNDTE
jgi:hypothetical protein